MSSSYLEKFFRLPEFKDEGILTDRRMPWQDSFKGRSARLQRVRAEAYPLGRMVRRIRNTSLCGAAEWRGGWPHWES